jgi:hypothetical protein
MPDSLKQSEKGQKSEEYVSMLDEAADTIFSVMEDLKTIVEG